MTAWYLRTRARNLALMHLTRREDIDIEVPSIGHGFELIVTIRRGPEHSGGMLGILTRAAMSARKTSEGVVILPDRTSSHRASFLKHICFPVCLFFFTMKDDKGYYKWVKEPAVTPKGTPKLALNKGTELKMLTNREIVKIISKVNAWYDRNDALGPWERTHPAC